MDTILEYNVNVSPLAYHNSKPNSTCNLDATLMFSGKAEVAEDMCVFIGQLLKNRPIGCDYLPQPSHTDIASVML